MSPYSQVLFTAHSGGTNPVELNTGKPVPSASLKNFIRFLSIKIKYLPDKSGSTDENRQEIDDRRRENCEQSAERNGSLKIKK